MLLFEIYKFYNCLSTTGSSAKVMLLSSNLTTMVITLTMLTFLPVTISDTGSLPIYIPKLLAKKTSTEYRDSVKLLPSEHSKAAGNFLSQLFGDFDHESALLVKPTNDKMTVDVLVRIDSVGELNEVNMDLTLTMSIRLSWTDVRLKLKQRSEIADIDHGLHNGMDSIVLPPQLAKMLWIPDFFLEGSKDSYTHKTIQENSVMRIDSVGKIVYETKLTTKSACFLDLQYFPMDRDQCNITIQSYGYAENELSFRWDEHQMDDDLFEDRSRIQAMPKFRIRHTSIHNASDDGHERNKTRLLISIEFERYGKLKIGDDEK